MSDRIHRVNPVVLTRLFIVATFARSNVPAQAVSLATRNTRRETIDLPTRALEIQVESSCSFIAESRAEWSKCSSLNLNPSRNH
jgi:hypothetical protein